MCEFTPYPPYLYPSRLSTRRIADRWLHHFRRACTYFLFVKDPTPPRATGKPAVGRGGPKLGPGRWGGAKSAGAVI